MNSYRELEHRDCEGLLEGPLGSGGIGVGSFGTLDIMPVPDPMPVSDPFDKKRVLSAYERFDDSPLAAAS